MPWRSRPLPVVEEQASRPSALDKTDLRDLGSSEAPICRLCWSEADDGWGGDLLSPCRCSGSLQFIHRRCLLDWQRTLRSQGLGRRATHCELCKTQYTVPETGSRWPRRRTALPRTLVLHARCALADATRLQCWPVLALRLWKGYVWTSGLVSTLSPGPDVCGVV